jgi:hypothetical protein
MGRHPLISRILLIIGGAAMLVGAIDPLEGSVVILIGNILILIGILLNKKTQQEVRFWTLTFVLTLFGIAAMFILSALGGFGGESELSWWWAVLILPYPIGWLLGIGGLISRVYKHYIHRPKTI